MLDKFYKLKDIHRFYCPYCKRRLWHPGSPKYFFFYLSEVSEIQRNINTSRQNVVFLANKSACVDSSCWIEEFFCSEDGKLWLKLTRNPDSTFVATLATSKDWKNITRTILPDTINHSVNELKRGN